MSRRRAQGRRPGQVPGLYIIGAVVVVFAVVIVAAMFVFGGGGGGGGGEFRGIPDDYPYPAQEPALLESRDHFPVGQTYDDYTSDPPTSGPHAGAPAAWGISDLAVAKEMAVHNMEHAGVVVWYNCNAGEAPLSTEECAQLRTELASVVQPAISNGESVVMTPYPDMDTQIALTAWGVLDSFDEFDAERVRTFIETFECRYDPEGFC